MLTVALHGAGGASACTITQLERNTLYNFFLIPFYKSIEGKPSNLIQTATLEDGKLDDFKCFLFIIKFPFLISSPAIHTQSHQPHHQTWMQFYSTPLLST